MTGRAGVPAEDRLAAVHGQLAAAVDALVDGPAWRRMLQVAARFHRYSANNVLLISLQRPDATRVAGYHTWRQLGRQVRKGEAGIAILAPVTVRRLAAADATPPDDPQPDRIERTLRGFRVTHVFDVSQTDGPPLPEVRPQLLDGAAPLGVWADLLDQIEAAGYRFGYAEIAPANGRTDHVDRTVMLRPDLTGAQSVKTLAHELAHVLLHQPGELPDGFTLARAEVEAESVAFVVCAAHGVASDDYTVPYVASWAGGDRELVRDAGVRVLSCARQILAVTAPGGDGAVTANPASRPADRALATLHQLDRADRGRGRASGRLG
jgi:antirestriction protein ArdC